MGMELYNDTYDLFCDLITKKNPEVLEIACGPGNITRHLLRKRADINLFGIDLSPNMIQLAKENNPTAEFQVMDCREISRVEKKFDAIMCGFCMPYLSKEECAGLIFDCSKLMNPGGVLYLSTMEGDYLKSGFETTSFSGQNKVFLYYHQVDFLSGQLEENGFTILHLIRKDYPEPDGTFLTDLIFVVRKE
jgi:2-polyprenyl-3-methyl-5-hydroxy-6-metoxy-1,4-benzoquinol methylase